MIKKMLETSEPFNGSFDTFNSKTNTLLFLDSYWNTIVDTLSAKSSPFLGDYYNVNEMIEELWRIKVKENDKMVDVIAKLILNKGD
jgi:hypothetical protein